MANVEAHGPIDFILIEYTEADLRGATLKAIVDLLNAGIVRLYDVAAIRRAADGSFSVVDLDTEPLAGFEALADLRIGLLDAEDLEAAASVLEPGKTGFLLVYENTWAIPFVAAALSEGGAPVASTRIPALDVVAALDALDSQS
jgi:Family of unknown function (DUF6325)